MSDIKEKVISIVADRLSQDAAAITDNSHLINDLGADSLDNAEILMDLEDAFGIKVPEEATDGLNTIGDILAYIESQVQK